jgi:hypothetical protein
MDGKRKPAVLLLHILERGLPCGQADAQSRPAGSGGENMSYDFVDRL